MAEGQKEPSGPQSDRHIQDILMQEFRIQASYRILDDLSVLAVVPFRHTSIDATFKDADGNLLPNFTSIHHRTETVYGLADVGMGLDTLLVAPSTDLPMTVSVEVGTTLPTGHTEPDPFKAGEQGLDHQHLFYGTGLFNPTLGLTLAYDFEDVVLRSVTRCQIALTSNDEDYTPPSNLSSMLTGISIFWK